VRPRPSCSTVCRCNEVRKGHVYACERSVHDGATSPASCQSRNRARTTSGAHPLCPVHCSVGVRGEGAKTCLSDARIIRGHVLSEYIDVWAGAVKFAATHHAGSHLLRLATACMGVWLSSPSTGAHSFFVSFFVRSGKPVSSSRPTHPRHRRAQGLSRLAVAPTLQRAQSSPGHTLSTTARSMWSG
jgi:hypothetical protein